MLMVQYFVGAHKNTHDKKARPYKVRKQEKNK